MGIFTSPMKCMCLTMEILSPWSNVTLADVLAALLMLFVSKLCPNYVQNICIFDQERETCVHTKICCTSRQYYFARITGLISYLYLSSLQNSWCYLLCFLFRSRRGRWTVLTSWNQFPSHFTMFWRCVSEDVVPPHADNRSENSSRSVLRFIETHNSWSCR